MLTDRAIRRVYSSGELRVDPFDAAFVRPAALSLRLGHEAFGLQSRGTVDIADRSTYPDLVPKDLDTKGRLVVEPGEAVPARAMGKIGLSENLVGLVDGTSDYARLGISVVLCGQVIPGFGRGKLAAITLEIVNHLRHPVLLYPETRTCNSMLLSSTGSEQPYDVMPHSYSSDQESGSSLWN
ncbi:dCTP deaminase [Amycolatopsis sp., V23-08]|uniref:dCTP deaminase n=1 Tax=Amycolatopsis heterodermiae TaxID=3110235 RepID=A0ABU5RLJ4_9PSEU|nr:dCTP deaminase [Amycolatopsis sp., V23-08]MEA5367163.1 dCTP deaminase [Amycolatopsis sp., V23-08]